MFVRRDVYVAVGGLDPKFFAHMEEIDLCWRLLSRGYRLVCIPESKVYHVGGATLKKENPKKTYLNFRNNLLMMYKNLPSDELRKVMIVRCFLDYLAVVFYILKFDFSNAFAVVKARKDYSSMRKDFKSLRDENLRKTKRSKLKFRYDFSLILQSKIFGKTTYSRLVK